MSGHETDFELEERGFTSVVERAIADRRDRIGLWHMAGASGRAILSLGYRGYANGCIAVSSKVHAQIIMPQPPS